ncbi:response regulator transcription factor [Afifella sp. IM 167]|uniref:response regulator n=1 Tax=Afifella sp. IM 167 TaxID=2033586 RepID=UPI001CCDD874|nr:response regulator transcription factor [Afifella sp. IM 167]MBZ8133902.1 DNA-binding response regulator [Afifella sp. IM 167]
MSERLLFVIADDHPLFRNALRNAIQAAFKDVEIVEAGTLDEVSAALDRIGEADIVLFDLKMPGARGFSGLMYLRGQYPAAPICIVSAMDDAATIRNAIGLGAAGFISKSASLETISEAIRAVLRGESWVPSDLIGEATDRETGELLERLRSLTPQQVRVLMMLGEGLLNKQIAYELGVSEATVKAHVSAILQKLGVENRTKAVLAAGRIEAGEWRGAIEP